MTRDGKLLAHWLIVCFCLGTSTDARADRKPDLSPTEQAIQADLIIVGNVDNLEGDLVQVSPYPGSPKAAHEVGSIKIADRILGAKGLTHARVGFIPQPANPNTGKYPFRGVNHSLTVGQEAVFFLTKHHEADLYLQIPLGPALNKKNSNYDKEIEAVKKLAKIIVDPMEALKAKEAADRQLAACLLVRRYRAHQPVVGNIQIASEPIPAEESKLILQTLAEMEWGQYHPDGIRSLTQVFLSMNLKAADGWTQPQVKANEDANKIIGDAARKWLKANAETYRIQRKVVKLPK